MDSSNINNINNIKERVLTREISLKQSYVFKKSPEYIRRDTYRCHHKNCSLSIVVLITAAGSCQITEIRPHDHSKVTDLTIRGLPDMIKLKILKIRTRQKDSRVSPTSISRELTKWLENKSSSNEILPSFSHAQVKNYLANLNRREAVSVTIDPSVHIMRPKRKRTIRMNLVENHRLTPRNSRRRME